MLSKQEALRLLDGNFCDKRKVEHAIGVAAIMKKLAKRLHGDAKKWELVGLLHDLDYEKTLGDKGQHGLVASKMLEGKLPEDCLHAIRTHDRRTGLKPESVMDKALIAADCFWGLILRAAWATSKKKIRQIKVSMMMDIFRDASFPKFLADGILMCREINFTPEEFFEFALESLPEEMSLYKIDLGTP